MQLIYDLFCYFENCLYFYDKKLCSFYHIVETKLFQKFNHNENNNNNNTKIQLELHINSPLRKMNAFCFFDMPTFYRPYVNPIKIDIQ